MSDDDFEVTAESIGGAPPIIFHFTQVSVTADLGGAIMVATANPDESSEMTITGDDGFVLARLVILPRDGRSQSQSIIDIACPLLWSHWRWLQAPEELRAAALPPHVAVAK